MDVMQAIQARRSIRWFQPDALSRTDIESILEAARLAPSAKNGQPWRFVVVQGPARQSMAEALSAGLARSRAENLPTGSAEYSFRIMAEAPATLLVFDPDDQPPWQPKDARGQLMLMVNSQSVGAAVQNMLLRAQELGIGSLWICDILFAHEELCAWAGRQGLLAAAVSLGYAAEQPFARPRLAFEDIVEWRQD